MTHESNISLTAHYTSFVWYKNGLADAALATPQGRWMYRGFAPVNLAYSYLSGRANLEMTLVGRHRCIDRLLESALDERGVTQVLELAAGLSSRGLRFVRRHPRVHYVETDLADVIGRKRARIARAGLSLPGHELATLDALGSFDAVGGLLDPARGLAVISEGLLNYLEEPSLRRLWRRSAELLRACGGGVYLADLAVAAEAGGAALRTYARFLSRLVKGGVYLHFETVDGARQALLEAGFSTVELHELDGGRSYPTRVIEARI